MEAKKRDRQPDSKALERARLMLEGMVVGIEADFFVTLRPLSFIIKSCALRLSHPTVCPVSSSSGVCPNYGAG